MTCAAVILQCGTALLGLLKYAWNVSFVLTRCWK